MELRRKGHRIPLVSKDTRLHPRDAQWRWATRRSCRWPATETSSESRTGRGGQTRILVLRRAAHVPGLRHNLLSAAQPSATFEHPIKLWPRATVFRCPRDVQSVIFRKSARRLFEATARRSAIVDQTAAKALVVAKPTTCDSMMFHQLVGHPGEDITRRTAQVAGLWLTGKWNACKKCSEARVMRHAVPKSTEIRADKRAGRVFIDLVVPLHVESLAESRFAMFCVDDFSRYKIVAFMAKKSDATAVLRAIIARYFAPAGLILASSGLTTAGSSKGHFSHSSPSWASNTIAPRRIRPSTTG